MEGRARNERGAISQKTQTLQIQILADSTVTVEALGESFYTKTRPVYRCSLQTILRTYCHLHPLDRLSFHQHLITCFHSTTSLVQHSIDLIPIFHVQLHKEKDENQYMH